MGIDPELVPLLDPKFDVIIVDDEDPLAWPTGAAVDTEL